MRIDVLYLPDCPNWQATVAAVEEAVRLLGYRDAVVSDTPIIGGDPRLHGSPTILIDGIDPFAAGPATSGCRLYWSEAGATGVPAVEELVAALRARRP